MSRSDQLTKRELEVLKLLPDGNSNKEIAELLVIQEGSVEAHLRHIYRKLGVSTRTQAAVYAVREGLVS